MVTGSYLAYQTGIWWAVDRIPSHVTVMIVTPQGRDLGSASGRLRLGLTNLKGGNPEGPARHHQQQHSLVQGVCTYAEYALYRHGTCHDSAYSKWGDWGLRIFLRILLIVCVFCCVFCVFPYVFCVFVCVFCVYYCVFFAYSCVFGRRVFKF